MKKPKYSVASRFAFAVLAAISFNTILPAQETAAQPLDVSEVVPNSEQVAVERLPEGWALTIQPGPAGYPGVSLKPKDPTGWDLSAFGRLEARVANTGEEPLSVSLRVDNKGDWKEKPWNVESASLKPGEAKTLKVIFGFSYGFKPGYKLNPAAITNLMLFTGTVAKGASLKIESIKAAGPAGETPPVDPNTVRTKPKEGFLLGGAAPLDAAKQIVAKDGAHASADPNGKTLQIRFSKAGQSIALKPPQGMWDLRDGYQVRVKIKNKGSSAISPAVRVDSKKGNTDKTAPAKPLAAGASTEIVASFIPAVTARIDNSDKPKPEAGTGTKFTSDAATAVTILADDAGVGEQAMEIEFIRLEAPPAEMPDWLGKRPPVEGDWALTFNEDFDGQSVDLKKWNIYTSNFWDKRTHFSKENVIVQNGVAHLRCERKTGRHNDMPDGKETDYATGYLGTYGKWVQRYGYFEARMKLPTAPGLWPAFWLMPDRGIAAGEQWKRADTANGGMEFDIMEYLSRWGHYCFHPAFHWDGYGKNHKSTGACVYTAHDNDGYITTGLLWLPDLAVIYNNGKEVTRWESPRISNIESHIIFTHVTGGWDNSPLDNALLPDDLVIDYVRCWQRKDLASAVDGVKSTQETPSAPTVADSPAP